MDERGNITSIVLVGGGTAGWITAGLIAAKHVNKNSPISVSLIESPSIPTIGVGEGTWPTMVNTLQQLGISELDFLQQCDASFKQASKFCQWVTGENDDSYYHPFSMPQDFDKVNCVPSWHEQKSEQSFAHTVSLQAHLCDLKKAPKQERMNDYEMVENHGYHLDAGKFTQLLTKHCTENLGVRHIRDDVVQIENDDNGDIKHLVTKSCGELIGDLFIDCTGGAALLIGKHFNIPLITQDHILFVDKAIAVQVPYDDPNQDIESATLSTAQSAGWIWDIGLPTRRGVGHVYSSRHIDAATAKQELINYLAKSVDNPERFTYREIDINPGYREKFWHKNCVAVGMSAGFLEPLEASALVMIETAAKTISLQLPAHREAMDVVASHFNENMTFRWQRVIDFLKLHYMLSKREDTAFWRDNKAPDSIPESLANLLTMWRYQAPVNNGFLSPYDLFPAASYQYILYGMGFKTFDNNLGNKDRETALAQEAIAKVKQRLTKVPPLLPSNREYLESIYKKNPHKVVNLATDTCSNWRYIDFTQLNFLQHKLPLFFKKEPNGFSCIALVGLDKHDFLIDNTEVDEKDYLATPCSSNEHVALTEALLAHSLLEPVSLDITLNDKSSVKVNGLHVIKQSELEKSSTDPVMSVFKDRWAKNIEMLNNSLQHVPKLINAKNLATSL